MARGRDADWSYQTGALASLLSRCFCRWPAVAFNSVANSLRRWIASSVCSDSVHGEWTEGFRSVAKRTIIANLAASKLRGKYPLAETFTRIGVHQHFHCIRKIKKLKKKKLKIGNLGLLLRRNLAPIISFPPRPQSDRVLNSYFSD